MTGLAERRELDRLLRELQEHVESMLYASAITPDRFQELTAKVLRARFLTATLGAKQ